MSLLRIEHGSCVVFRTWTTSSRLGCTMQLIIIGCPLSLAMEGWASSYEATELSKPSVRHPEHARLSPPTRHFPLTSISRHSNAMHTWQSEEMVALCYEMQNVERIPKNKFHRSSMELGYAGLEWTSLTWSWVHASPLFSDLVKKEYVGPAALSVFCFVCGAHI